MTDAFAALSAHKYMSLTTHKKDGSTASTPVWLLPKDGKLYVWTNADSVKVKRLRRDPRCSVAPCNASGKSILGPAVNGTVRFLEGDDAAAISAAIKARYGFQFSLIAGLNKIRGFKNYAVLEISAA